MHKAACQVSRHARRLTLSLAPCDSPCLLVTVPFTHLPWNLLVARRASTAHDLPLCQVHTGTPLPIHSELRTMWFYKLSTVSPQTTAGGDGAERAVRGRGGRFCGRRPAAHGGHAGQHPSGPGTCWRRPRVQGRPCAPCRAPPHPARRSIVVV